MDCVIGTELAEVILKNGGFPIFHRFADTATKLEWTQKFEMQCILSSGVNKEDLEFVDFVLRRGVPVLGICFDVAHGHSKKMLEAVRYTKDLSEKHNWGIEVIAGNVCTPMGYTDLVHAGADAVKIGIGGGSACTTRKVTGFGVPQFTAIYECAKIANKLRVPIIADGAIRGSDDIVKALAAGASTVMIGKLFAGTEESAAKKFATPELVNAIYRGQASEDFQLDHFGEVKAGTVPEGESMWIPVTGTAQELIDRLLGGVRSGMTYGGARNIKELQRKAEFIEVTDSYPIESGVRKG
jgi:IMP dehydrogenase